MINLISVSSRPYSKHCIYTQEWPLNNTVHIERVSNVFCNMATRESINVATVATPGPSLYCTICLGIRFRQLRNWLSTHGATPTE